VAFKQALACYSQLKYYSVQIAVGGRNLEFRSRLLLWHLDITPRLLLWHLNSYYGTLTLAMTPRLLLWHLDSYYGTLTLAMMPRLLLWHPDSCYGTPTLALAPRILLWYFARCSVAHAPRLCGVLISGSSRYLYHVMSLGSEAAREKGNDDEEASL
jgi:hypothetical protein